MGRKGLLWRGVLSLSLLGAAAGASLAGAACLLPSAGVAAGVRLDGRALPAGTDPEVAVAERAAALRARKVVLRHDGAVRFEASLAELGVEIDEARAVAELAAVGRRGDLPARLDDAWEARSGRSGVTLSLRLPVDALHERLAAFKDAFDHKPVPARWDFARSAATPHEDGAMVDVYATAEAIARAARDGDVDLPLSIVRTAPRATREVVEAIDLSAVVSSFETRFAFAGDQAGRATNVARAAEGIHGLVMMPGETISFNELVGPRSEDNGFAEAGEIYKGEMRMGIGGGTCQVASTFHAAAFFGGLDIVERSPHSRPSGYIGIGLDATVAFPHVDLKMRNPHPFPVVIRAEIVEDGGTLRVEVRGREDVADVDYAAATVGVKPYTRKIREAHWLPPGEVKRSQAGRQGVTIEKVRTIRYADGKRRVETTRDHYPPTQEIYFVPAGSDPAELLPPLAGDAPDQSG